MSARSHVRREFRVPVHGTARVFGCAVLISAFLIGVQVQQVLAIQAKPATAWSYYVRNTSMDPNEAYTLGCNQGHSDTTYSQGSEVILDFGAQDFSGPGGSAGTRLTVVNTFVTYAQITAYAREFAHGYWVCTGSNTTTILRLAIGTNNSNYSFDRVDFGGGQDWANLVVSIRSTVASFGYSSQVVVYGASDMEPGFHSASSTRNWINGYSYQTTARLINYGSADGCPPYGSCNNGWTSSDVYYVSWGNTNAFSLPEIYYSANAQQWAQISLYGVTSGQTKITFDGPLDEHTLNTSTNTSDQAWTQLWNQVNADSRTASNFSYSAEIHISTAP